MSMHRHRNGHVFLHARTVVLGLARALSVGLAGVANAAPTPRTLHLLESREHRNNVAVAEGGALWVLYAISMALVLLGGAFAGLTIALMGQDEIYLRVISLDRDEPQHKNASRVYHLLNRGKHWVLVTLLLSNVIVNETLPVVLDRCFGGGVAAVVGSTILIVIFGEIIPQSLCVRYGLQIGGYMAQPVLVLMYVLAPVAWPTAKLLDSLLGENHGTIYKKSGLKTLVTLHKTLGDVDERLNQDEVTIISAVLDLKRKAVEEVMTPMEDVFVMSEDTILDEKTIEKILDAGYSRIPVHQSDNPTNFIGMLLVKILISYDPEDAKTVKEFALATLPETRPETSCLDIINFFQEGKSHMVLVSENPGEDHGALGVVTLEDVIEELIGEEIIDESDVYVDIHKAIRRAHPGPHVRGQWKDLMVKDMAIKEGTLMTVKDGALMEIRDGELIDLHEEEAEGVENPLLGRLSQRPSFSGRSTDTPVLHPKTTTLFLRRSSMDQDDRVIHTTVPVRANMEDMRDHLKNLGPSNPASNPKSTRVSAVKIKPGFGSSLSAERRSESVDIVAGLYRETDERASLLRPQLAAKDAVKALHHSTSYERGSFQKPSGEGGHSLSREITTRPRPTNSNDSSASPAGSSEGDANTRRRGRVRSGSITESIVEAGGIRKVVLETNSLSDTDEDDNMGKSPAAAKSPSIGSIFNGDRSSNRTKRNRNKKRREGS
ncbi:hypothetical protein GGR50DRAFT_687743 [Xylaria sp. CBS 124048]|nr:hypothetical protein GGR50DRAFT_687743 [Xylaria sp. CBS 124048]